MNRERRKELNKIIERLYELESTIEDLKSDLECVMDEEQDCYDNLPENLQESERAYTMQEALDNLQYAIDGLNEVDFSDIESYIEEAME